MIGRVESPRSLYGGYVGINSADGICAYVNLRSMCFNPDGGYCIYSGGGITSQSDTADEWLETEAKSAVLRRCIANHTFTSAKPTHTTPNDSESSSTPSL
jgi:anthranilate/para-aminobenzoate synthase component I